MKYNLKEDAKISTLKENLIHATSDENMLCATEYICSTALKNKVHLNTAYAPHNPLV